MPDAEGVNTKKSEGTEVGPDENLTEKLAPEATGTSAPPTPSDEPVREQGSTEERFGG